MTVAEVRALREAGRHAEHGTAAQVLVVAHPDDAEAQLEAAFAHDRAGREQEAIRHYEQASLLGVPAALMRAFAVGYGSTLRNVGRADDAVGVLGQAIAGDPAYAPYAAFLGLALLDAGHPRLAVATLLGCALEVARPDGPDRLADYARALGAYQRELLELPP